MIYLKVLILGLAIAWAIDRLFIRKRGSKVQRFKNENFEFGECLHYNKFKLVHDGKSKWFAATDKEINEMRIRAIEHPEINE